MSDPNQQPTDNSTVPWYGANAEDKAYVEAKGFKDGAAALTSYRNLETLIGADKAGRTVVLPKDEKDVDGIKAFRAKLGVPEKADGYTLPDDLKDTLKDDPMVPAFAAAALEAGIPSSAFGSVLSKVVAAAKKIGEESANKAKQASEDALTALKGEWGGDFDKNAELARRYVRTGGITEDDLGAIEAALGTSKFLKMFHALGQKLGEPAPAGGAQGGGQSNAKVQAQEKLNELRKKRIAGQVDERTYLAESERLGAILDAA